MKLVVLVFGLVAAVAAYEPITVNYHENYGIAEAARIKALESALDFDGSRIVGGSNARLGQYPHMGGLVITVPQGTSVCGSSLISNTRLVTAAHCWNDGNTQARSFTVVLGSVTLFSGGHRVTATRVVMHPQWNPRAIRDDVAVIHIPRVNYNNNIRNINMASGSNLFVGANAMAAGFGRKGDNVNIAANQPLSHVQLQVITNDVCRRTFSQIQPTNICTSGAGGRSPCPGDSGGPLAVNNQLVGIVSFGSAAGCSRGFPAAFARVSSYVAWIRQQ